MTEEEAIALHDSEFWKPMSYEERAKFQMLEERLCMPFDVFHEAVEKALGRSVWTHEFGMNREGLILELFHGEPAPSMGEIMGLIPEDKRILVVMKP